MAFSTELCKTGAEMELNVYDGTVRDIIFTEDSVNRSTVFMSGGAGNCRIHSTYCSNGHTFASYKGHTDACIVKVLCSYSWPLHMGQWVVRELFSKQDSAFLGLALTTGNQRRYSQQQNRHASTMQTPKEWNIESLLGELVESSDRDNMADSDTVEYAITLETQNRMNEGSEPLKPNHIDFAYEALRGKGLLFPIKPRRSPFLYMLHTVLACPQVLNPGITRHVGRKDFWMRVFLHL